MLAVTRVVRRYGGAVWLFYPRVAAYRLWGGDGAKTCSPPFRCDVCEGSTGARGYRKEMPSQSPFSKTCTRSFSSHWARL